MNAEPPKEEEVIERVKPDPFLRQPLRIPLETIPIYSLRHPQILPHKRLGLRRSFEPKCEQDWSDLHSSDTAIVGLVVYGSRYGPFLIRWQKAVGTSGSARERENAAFEAFPIGAGFSFQRNRRAGYAGCMFARHIRRQHKAYGAIAIVFLEVVPDVLDHNRRDPFVSLRNKGVRLDRNAGLVGKQVFPASVELLSCPASKLEVRRVLAYIAKPEAFPFMSVFPILIYISFPSSAN